MRTLIAFLTILSASSVFASSNTNKDLFDALSGLVQADCATGECHVGVLDLTCRSLNADPTSNGNWCAFKKNSNGSDYQIRGAEAAAVFKALGQAGIPGDATAGSSYVGANTVNCKAVRVDNVNEYSCEAKLMLPLATD